MSEELKALLEGLEVQNIEQLDGQPPEVFKILGQEMTRRTKRVIDCFGVRMSSDVGKVSHELQM